MATIRTLVFDDPRMLHIEERPTPQPSPGEVRIRKPFADVLGARRDQSIQSVFCWVSPDDVPDLGHFRCLRGTGHERADRCQGPHDHGSHWAGGRLIAT
jgi:hypothetical protein